MTDMSFERLKEFVEARPVRDHVRRIRVLDGYHGAVAYFDQGLVISPDTWEMVKGEATIHAADIGHAFHLTSVPVEIVDAEDPDHARLMNAWKVGLFAKVNDAGGVER